jgi:L-fuculose-phosphate aldolase
MTQNDEVRADLVRHSQLLISEGLCIGTSGNLSVRVDDRIFITPSGIRSDVLSPDQIAVLDLDGQIVDAPVRPSSESPFHIAIYNATDAVAVAHCHSMYATALSTVCAELPAIHYMIYTLGGTVRVVPYKTFGTAELAEEIRIGIENRQAAIIQNHGTIAYGSSLAEAFQRARLLEWLSELYLHARQFGTPHILTDAQLDEVREQGRKLRYAFGDAS